MELVKVLSGNQVLGRLSESVWVVFFPPFQKLPFKYQHSGLYLSEIIMYASMLYWQVHFTGRHGNSSWPWRKCLERGKHP